MKFELSENENEVIVSTYQRIYTAIVKKIDDDCIKDILNYCEKNNIYPYILEEDKLREILELGIVEYNKRHIESQV